MSVTIPAPSDTQLDAVPVPMQTNIVEMPTSKLAWAMRMVEWGLAVFPLQEGKKIPLAGSRGHLDATTDIEKIRAWWVDPQDGSMRSYNIGATPQDGKQIVVDLDVTDGKDGIENYKALGGEIGGRIVKTATGGLHIFYHGENLKTGAGVIAAGVDTRGKDGYVVAPGSVIDGVAYEVVGYGEPLPVPDFVAELVGARQDKDATSQRPAKQTVQNDLPQNVNRFVEFCKTCKPAENGIWHFRDIAITCEAVRCAVSLETARDAMLAYWVPNCRDFYQDGRDERWPGDVESCYRSALKMAPHGEHALPSLVEAFGKVVTEADVSNHPKGKAAREEREAAEKSDPWLTNLPSGLNGSNIVALSATDCANVPTPPYLIKGILAKGQMAAVAALPGSGKSCFAPLLAYRMSQGVTVFGHRTRPGRVAYFGLEDEHGMAGRITALQRKYGEAAEFRLFIRARNLLTCVEEQEEIKRMVRAGRPDLVVFDTVRAGWRGLSENDSDAMSAVVAFVRELTRGADGEAGPAVILIHHTTKSGGRTMAGSGVLEADADTTMFLEKDPETGVVEVSFGKNRNGESAGNEIYFRIEPVQITTDEDGDPVTRPIAVEEDARTVRREKGLSAAQAHALAILEGLVADTPPVVADLEMGGMFFGGARSVEREAWELACEVQQLSKAEKPADRTRAFRRAVTDLVRLKRVAPLGSNIFLLKQGVK